MPIQIGDLLGDYQVTGVLGRGGMGMVFRVRSLVSDREEAMRVVLTALSGSERRVNSPVITRLTARSGQRQPAED